MTDLNTQNQLLNIIMRLERLENERDEIKTDMRQVFAEAKGNGFDVKVIRQILRLRKMDKNTRDEQTFLLEEYKNILGI